MKKGLLFAVALGLMLSLFAGCTSNKEAKKQTDSQDMIQEVQQSGDLQPGATVTTGSDENGNAILHYANPDGTSGGGVAP